MRTTVRLPEEVLEEARQYALDSGTTLTALFEEALRAEGHREVTRREYPLLGHAFWFWDDPSRHGPEEIAEANAAWADFTGFLAKHLGLS